MNDENPESCYTVRCSTDGILHLARSDPQINVRLPPDRFAVLEAAAFVRGIGSPGALAQEVLLEAIERWSDSESVKKALEARLEHLAAEEGTLSHIASARRRPTGESRQRQR